MVDLFGGAVSPIVFINWWQPRGPKGKVELLHLSELVRRLCKISEYNSSATLRCIGIVVTILLWILEMFISKVKPRILSRLSSCGFAFSNNHELFFGAFFRWCLHIRFVAFTLWAHVMIWRFSYWPSFFYFVKAYWTLIMPGVFTKMNLICHCLTLLYLLYSDSCG